MHMDGSMGVKRSFGWDAEGSPALRGLSALPKELRHSLHRIKYNMSLTQATKLDKMFRLFLLSTLVEMQVKDGLSIIIPEGANVT